MTEKTTNKPLKIRAYHSESATRKGESTAAYKARIAQENAEEQRRIQAENQAKIEAAKRGKINSKTTLIFMLILGAISVLCTLYFVVTNLVGLQWIFSPYVYLFATISMVITGISNRILTFLEQK